MKRRRQRPPHTSIAPERSIPNPEDIITNPVYTGLGPYPRVVEDSLWVSANARAIQELGVKPWLMRHLRLLHEAFPINGRRDVGGIYEQLFDLPMVDDPDIEPVAHPMVPTQDFVCSACARGSHDQCASINRSFDGICACQAKYKHQLLSREQEEQLHEAAMNEPSGGPDHGEDD